MSNNLPVVVSHYKRVLEREGRGRGRGKGKGKLLALYHAADKDTSFWRPDAHQAQQALAE